MSDTDPSKQEGETKPVAEKESDLPKFEKEQTDKITAKFGDKAQVVFVKPDRIRINVKKEDILDVASFIRDELNYDHAESVTGIDFPDEKEIEVVYHLGSYTDPQLDRQVLSSLATRAPREDTPNPGNDSTKLSKSQGYFFTVLNFMKENVLRC